MNSETETTINGVRREYWITKYQRVCRFYIEGSRFESCVVLQGCDIDVPTIWRSPDFSGSTTGAKSVDGINLNIEALRQAAEVFAEWEKDTGKEIARND